MLRLFWLFYVSIWRHRRFLSQKTVSKFPFHNKKSIFAKEGIDLYAALFPGLGQVYNGKYWKLPIVYGGYVGLIYVLGWNSNNYNDYFNAYKTIAKYQAVSQMSKVDKDYLNELFKIPYWDLNINPSHFDSFKTQLKGGKDYYRRSRDMSVIAIAALHVLSIIDASVDANLSDFDIGDSLSMHIEPMPMNFGIGPQVIGLNVAFNF